MVDHHQHELFFPSQYPPDPYRLHSKYQLVKAGNLLPRLKEVELLCDDRNIIRKQTNGFRIYGTWSHGEIPLVSANSAPLKAIFFLEKSDRNFLVPIENRQLIVKGLLSFLIKPFVSVDWWEKSLSLIEDITCSVPCYSLYFNKSGEVVELLRNLR